MSVVKEFKEFISRGNVMDLAVGVIVGAAFTGIVDSLVADVIMPLISIFTGGIDFTAWQFVIGTGENAATVHYGNFFASVLNFFIVAAAIFLMVKGINKLNIIKKSEVVATTKQCPYCKESINIEATRCSHCTADIE